MPAALTLAERDQDVVAALGIHPHQAAAADAERIDELRSLLEHPQGGRSGGDRPRLLPRLRAARRAAAALRAQLELADELASRSSIHTRAADDDTLAALAGVRRHGRPPLLLLAGAARAALERGWYVSFAGNVTYPKAPELRRGRAPVPADRILAETDSPYLAPQPVRGRPNEPAYVVHTLAALAEARGEEQTSSSARSTRTPTRPSGCDAP